MVTKVVYFNTEIEAPLSKRNETSNLDEELR